MNLRATLVVACVFAFSVGWAKQTNASCGDYLHHAIHVQPLGDPSDDTSNRTPGCRKGNCNSVPSDSPIDFSKLTFLKRVLSSSHLELVFESQGTEQRAVDTDIPPSPELGSILRPPIA